MLLIVLFLIGVSPYRVEYNIEKDGCSSVGLTQVGRLIVEVNERSKDGTSWVEIEERRLVSKEDLLNCDSIVLLFVPMKATITEYDKRVYTTSVTDIVGSYDEKVTVALGKDHHIASINYEEVSFRLW